MKVLLIIVWLTGGTTEIVFEAKEWQTWEAVHPMKRCEAKAKEIVRNDRWLFGAEAFVADNAPSHRWTCVEIP